MYLPTLILTHSLLGLLAHTTSGASSSKNLTRISPFPVAPISWTGPLEHGSENITIHGWHHEVVAKLQELQPYWMRNASALDEHLASLREQVSAENTSTLEKRGGRSAYSCNDGYFDGKYTAAVAGYNYIFYHFGMGSCGVGPYSCGRFACSYDTAILMCNSANDWAVIPCGILGMNSEFVTDACGSIATDQIQGQAFYVEPNYNVLIKETDPGKSC